MREDVVRQAATDDDVHAAGRLLHRFNTEYDDPTPSPEVLAARLGELIEADTVVLLADEPPAGIAVLRLRPAIWSSGLECYLAELYVTPERRGHGLGRALMEAAIAAARTRGADRMDIATTTADVEAVGLYESCGFTDLEGGPGGSPMIFYEREL